jgi:hypothetical protein
LPECDEGEECGAGDGENVDQVTNHRDFSAEEREPTRRL